MFFWVFFRLFGVILFLYAFFVQLFLVFVFWVCLYISECPFVRDESTNMDNQANRILCFSHLVGDARNVLMLASERRDKILSRSCFAQI